jgi:hypothetical protein
MDARQVDEKLRTYATEYIRGYTEVLDKHYYDIFWKVHQKGLELAYFPLYKRKLGRNVAIATLYTDNDFYLFFVEERDMNWKITQNARESEEFTRDWTFNTPDDIRQERVKQYLGLNKSIMLGKVSVPGANLMAMDVKTIGEQGYNHGNNFGMQAGKRAEKELPEVLEFSARIQALEDFGKRYKGLKTAKITTQARGRDFEILWREVLEFYGWKPKKIRISGEENDFTAINQGLHILGEVRWFAKPMTGGKLREFLGKLDPRPQTIGLFISHSGLDDGAWSVIRRAVNTKTVVVFSKTEIEEVLLNHKDPAELFDDGLRDAYDHVFEKQFKK